MGGLLSTPNSSPSDFQQGDVSSNPALETKSPGNGKQKEASIPSIDRTVDEKGPDSSNQLKVFISTEEEGDEGEEGGCGLCLFMKGGGCRESFTAWEKCVEGTEKGKDDIVGKCFEATRLLKTCMEQHADYYFPVLQAEKAAEQEAVKELEQEKASLSETKNQKDASADKEQQGDNMAKAQL